MRSGAPTWSRTASQKALVLGLLAGPVEARVARRERSGTKLFWPAARSVHGPLKAEEDAQRWRTPPSGGSTGRWSGSRREAVPVVSFRAEAVGQDGVPGRSLLLLLLPVLEAGWERGAAGTREHLSAA